MTSENTDIKTGMKVYALDTEDLGHISHVWKDVGESPTATENYFVVTHGGFLGMGEHNLYIPFDAVEAVDPGESVTVNCSKEHCVDLYTSKPDCIKKKEEEVMAAEAAIIASTTPVIFH